MTTKLVCSAVQCVNNINNLCTANLIRIEGNRAHTSSGTFCYTFAEKGLGNAIANLTNMNFAGEVKQIFSKEIEMSPIINCSSVNCTYNIGGKCSASDVKITGEHAHTKSGTYCETFKE